MHADTIRGFTELDLMLLPFALLALAITCTGWLFWALGRRSVLVRLRALADQSKALERVLRAELKKAEEGSAATVSLLDQIDEAHETYEVLADAHRRLAR